MSVALLGLIGFQIFWINNAIKLSNERFDKDVQESLGLVVERLERKDALDHTMNRIKFFPQGNVSVRVDSSESGSFVYQSDDFTRTVEVKVDSDDDGNVFISQNEQVIPNDSMKVRVKRKTELMTWVMDGIVDHENRDDRITLEVIDSLLEDELNNKGIHTHYEFAVFDRRQDSIVIASTSNTSPLIESVHTANLFPNDILGNANYLSVNFPDKSQYLFKDIWTTLITSVLFMAIIIGCFTYALIVIARQKKLAEMKNDFLNNMTHEFKTPLATVSLAAETIGEVKKQDASVSKYLGVIREETKNLEGQVERILEIARMDRGNMKLNLEKNDLRSIVSDSLTKMEFQFREHSANFELKQSSSPLFSNIDSVHFSNVITNILDNALKYNDRDPEVIISMKQEGGFNHVSISDNGIGMSKKEVRHIFEKFYRVQSGDVYRSKGFGLGLSYSLQVIKGHRGAVEVNSVPGKGSEFIVKLPVV